jgi:hypothetical protein
MITEHKCFGVAAMIEKRASPRHRVLKQGTIAFRGGGGIDCMVRNLSQGGARLEVATPFGLHGSFTLVIATDHFMRDCHTVWSIEKRVGVAFE